MSDGSTAAPVLRAADVSVDLTTPRSCDVTMSLRVEGAAEIDHRVDAGSPANAAGIELLSVEGARQASPLNTVGRTQSLLLRPEAATYRIHYRAQLRGDGASRCPLWLPTVPADGLSRTVTIAVELPPGSTSSDSMPMLEWTGVHGAVTLGHLPSFVRVSHGPAGTASGWGITKTMDAVTVAIIVLATALWIWRRRS